MYLFNLTISGYLLLNNWLKKGYRWAGTQGLYLLEKKLPPPCTPWVLQTGLRYPLGTSPRAISKGISSIIKIVFLLLCLLWAQQLLTNSMRMPLALLTMVFQQLPILIFQ